MAKFGEIEPTVLRQSIDEGWSIISELRPLLFGPDGQGNLWGPLSSPGAPTSNAFLYIFQSPWFLRLVRWQSEYLYKTNGYAISLCDNRVNMILGKGFKYLYEPDQVAMDKWLYKNKYSSISREAFLKQQIWGEVFYRFFTNEDGYRDIRFVHPDNLNMEDGNLGVYWADNDYHEVKAFNVGGIKVASEDMQHRAYKFTEEKRGTSILFAISQHLINAEELLLNLTRTADQLARYAAIMTHQGNQDSANKAIDGLNATPLSLRTPFSCSHFPYSSMPAGSVVHVPSSINVDFPGQYIDGDKYISVLRAVLRLIAARGGLPENVLSQDNDSIAAYSGQMQADSHTVKGLEAQQQQIVDWDRELFEKAGFDPLKVQIVTPEIAIHDADQLVSKAKFGKDNRLVCNDELTKMVFDLDYEEQIKKIKEDDVNDPPPVETMTGENLRPVAGMRKEKTNG